MTRLAMILALGVSPALTHAQGLPALVGGEYALTNQFGQPHTQADPDGRPQLLFFGYANCLQICSSVLPQMAVVADDIAAQTGTALRPVMITVDPKIDTVDTIGPALSQYHDDGIGLTGSEEALQVAYDAFSVEVEYLFDDPQYGPVYSHGSFIYLLDGEGKTLTLIPPILSDDEIVKIIRNYIG